MNSRWIKILLAASLAFNLAFVATAIYRYFTAPEKVSSRKTPKEQELKLGENQRSDIEKIVKAFRIDMLEYKQKILDKRIAIIEAMSDTEFNPEEIERRTGELNKLENQLNLAFVDTLLQINALLEPQQRLNFLYKLSKDWFFINKGRREREPNRHDRSTRYRRRYE
jgi:Spy/CpxP family protein refolding chaperone